jgi:hypothetical protein
MAIPFHFVAFLDVPFLDIFVYDSSCNFPRVLVGFVPDKLDGDSFLERAVMGSYLEMVAPFMLNGFLPELLG